MIQISWVADFYNADGSDCYWAMWFYWGREVGKLMVNQRDNILPFHNLNVTELQDVLNFIKIILIKKF